MGRGDRLSKSDTPSADVHLTLPPEDYDRADAIAKRKRTSIQHVIRDALKRLFEDERGGTLET